ncbi:MAG: toprim domain-containing protein [Vibrio hibernica]
MNKDKYIQACFDGALGDIENAPQGMANDTLNNKAFRLYQAVGAGQFSEQEVTQGLEQAASNRKIPKAEIKDTLKSARKGTRTPKPFGNLEGVNFNADRHNVANEFDDLDALAKQQKSLEWYERIKGNQPTETQPYLVKKKLIAYRNDFFTGHDKKGEFLAYTLHNEKSDVCGFGRVYADGEKRNTAGCGTTGVYYAPFMGIGEGDTCYITEGAADACSISAVTGCDAYAAISSGTMLRVAELFKNEYSKVFCCLDNDNAGREAGRKLVAAGFDCFIPEIEDQDFSDVFVSGGDNAMLARLKHSVKFIPEEKPVSEKMTTDTAQISLEQFVLSDFGGMKAMLENDNWVMDRIALEGQITHLFAQPNSGKTLLTLKMIFNSVQQGRIIGESVFYVNSDDTLRGLTTKAELSAQYGIRMLASGFNNFKNEHLAVLLEQMAERGEAKGKIIILDTLKKFTDLMNKGDSSKFNEIMRTFVAKGGTVIALAHVNKSRDAEGKLIYQGTSDSVDDADCCYTIDVVNVSEDSFQGRKIINKTVLFENFKARGDNVDKLAFTYQKVDGEPYESLLNSVKTVDEAEAAKAEKQARINDLLDKHEDEIQLVFDAIDSGINTTQKIIEFLMDDGVSRALAQKVLKDHTGNNVTEGHRWFKEKGEKNQRIFKRLF